MCKIDSPTGMLSLIPVVNKLRGVLQRTGSKGTKIELPQIVAIGSQSSGKSSVLEGLVRKELLPRGDGMVTRCPIVLMLIHTPGMNERMGRVCPFTQKIFTDFDEVQKEIMKKTDEITGDPNSISAEEIRLSVYSPNVLTLTVVDLPGITKIALNGQADVIPEQTLNLAMQYISKENTIILAVSDGSINIANSDSLKLAKSVDPREERTIAVVTKSDLAEGEDLRALIVDHSVKLQLGLIAVMNRSRKDMEDGVSFEDVLVREQEFFAENYPQVAKNHGTNVLAKTLNRILMHHIQKCCPSLDMQVKDMLSKTEAQLNALGRDDQLDDIEKFKTLTSIITDFSEKFKAQIDGQRRGEIDTEAPCAHTRLTYAIEKNLPLSLRTLDPSSSITDHNILYANANPGHTGIHTFEPQKALDALIKKQVAKMKPIALHSTKLVYQEMSEVVRRCIDNSHRFPAVNAEIVKVVTAMLDRMMTTAKLIVENYIDVQAVSAFTNNEGYNKEVATFMANVNNIGLGRLPEGTFMSAEDELMTLSDGSVAASECDQEMLKNQADLFQKIRNLVTIYFNITRDQVADHVPKSLLHSLVYAASNQIMKELINEMSSIEKAKHLIREEKKTVELRESLIQEVEEFRKAADILAEVREAGLLG